MKPSQRVNLAIKIIRSYSIFVAKLEKIEKGPFRGGFCDSDWGSMYPDCRWEKGLSEGGEMDIFSPNQCMMGFPDKFFIHVPDYIICELIKMMAKKFNNSSFWPIFQKNNRLSKSIFHKNLRRSYSA
jgi:hypothetical protein